MGHTHEVHHKSSNVIVFHGGIKTLNNVLYMLKVKKKDLFLVGALANIGCVMIFGRTSCWIIIVSTPHKIIATS